MSTYTSFPISLVIACTVSLSGCASLDALSWRSLDMVRPYKPEIVQGNFVSKEQRQALQIGMPRVQVREILGSPLLTSVFHADRWEYVFTIFRQGVEPQERKLTVFFDGDRLSKVEGDELISESEFVQAISTGRRVDKVPVLELPAEQLPPAPRVGAETKASSAGADATAAPPRSYPPLEPTVR